MEEVQNHLDNLNDFTINYFKNLKKKYGKAYPRLTEIVEFESIESTKVVSNNAKLYANKAEGFVGTNLKKEDNAEFICLHRIRAPWRLFARRSASRIATPSPVPSRQGTGNPPRNSAQTRKKATRLGLKSVLRSRQAHNPAPRVRP